MPFIPNEPGVQGILDEEFLPTKGVKVDLSYSQVQIWILGIPGSILDFKGLSSQSVGEVGYSLTCESLDDDTVELPNELASSSFYLALFIDARPFM